MVAALALMLAAVLTWGCTTHVTVHPEKPPLAIIPERPALVDEYGSFSKEGRAWVDALIMAYVRNCVTLRVLRGENPLECQNGLR